MQNLTLAGGVVLMLVGIALVVTAVFRSLNHRWGYGLYEVWLLPTIGVALILLGRWLIQ